MTGVPGRPERITPCLVLYQGTQGNSGHPARRVLPDRMAPSDPKGNQDHSDISFLWSNRVSCTLPVSRDRLFSGPGDVGKEKHERDGNGRL